MSTKGLTATQASILVAMRSGHQMLYMPGTPRGKQEIYWMNNMSLQGVTSSARKLEREGYIEKFNVRASGGAELRLTEKGKTAMSTFDQSYHRVASLAEAAAEDTSQAAKRATIHAIMKGSTTTLCGRLTDENVQRMGVIRIVDCPDCREALVAANRKQTSFAKMTNIGTPLSQRITDMTLEQKQAMLTQIEEMQESGEWDRMVQKIHAEVANRKQTQGSIIAEHNEAYRNMQRTQALLERDADSFRKLRECCGYVENASEQTVRIFQDDATRGWIVKCGDERMISSVPAQYSKPRNYHANSLNEAIDIAYVVEKQEN